MVFWGIGVYGDLRLLNANDLRVGIIENVNTFGVGHEVWLDVERFRVRSSIGAGFSTVGGGNFLALGWVGEALILFGSIFCA